MKKSPVFLILLLASVRSEDRCPATSIVPCVCYEASSRPNLECSQIADEDQLEDIFKADFPVPNVEHFSLSHSTIIRLSRNVFGNVSFDKIYIAAQNIQSVSEDAFANSIETLVNLEFVRTQITQDTFNFESLRNYVQLTDLLLRNNSINQFPFIMSESLISINIWDNIYLTNVPSDALAGVGNLTTFLIQDSAVTTLDSDAFRGAEQLEDLTLRRSSIVDIPSGLFLYLPNVKDIDLSGNQITDIVSGALTNITSLRDLDFSENRLQTVSAGDFDFNPKLETIDLIGNEITYVTPGSFENLPHLEFIQLGFNNISSLATDTFRGLDSTSIYIDNNIIDYIAVDAFGTVKNSTVDLKNNLLTDVYEFWLGPLLDAENYVELSGNPITCGCEISWLFDDPTYLENLHLVCANGTDIASLDPDYYIENC